MAIEVNVNTLLEVEGLFGTGDEAKIFVCPTCGYKETGYMDKLHKPCPKCNPLVYKSIGSEQLEQLRSHKLLLHADSEEERNILIGILIKIRSELISAPAWMINIHNYKFTKEKAVEFIDKNLIDFVGLKEFKEIFRIK